MSQNDENVAGKAKEAEKLVRGEEELNLKWGYDMYPERRQESKFSWIGFLFVKNPENKRDMYKCEKKVVQALDHPVIKLFMGAFRTAGCELNIRRHICCEVCSPLAHGGYDPITNQIVICYNNTKSRGMITGVLIHEFIHMYDYCTNKVDFTNLDHLACTEIRAANLTHCTYSSWLLSSGLRTLQAKRKHRECVMDRAVASIVAVRDVTAEEAWRTVYRVFDKCYADMEPIGRRICHKSKDPLLIYAEGFMFGYD